MVAQWALAANNQNSLPPHGTILTLYTQSWGESKVSPFKLALQ